VISVADVIVGHLRRAGVGTIFGVPGGGSNLDLIDAAGRAGVTFVLTATETGAAVAAIAQAEISGRPGACLTTLGPGVTSVVNGVACAWLDRAPLLVFTDSHPTSTGGVFQHQRLDHRALLAPVTKWSTTLSPANAQSVMRKAVDCAMAPPCGPVHLECPGDVLSAEARGDKPVDRHGVGEGIAREPGNAGRVLFAPAISLLKGARRPLLLVGLGARRSIDAEAIRSLCLKRGVPAMVTYKAKGVVPDGDLHFAGVFTNGTIEQSMVAEADLLLAVGLDPVELIPRPWAYAQTIVHIGPARVDDDHIPFSSQFVSDIPSAMQLAEELLSQSSWDLDAIHEAVVSQRRRLCLPSSRLAAHRVVQIAADAAATQARVTVDAGAHMFPATMLWPVAEPNGMLISNGLSTMGFALPAAIGAALLDHGPHGPAKAGHYQQGQAEAGRDRRNASDDGNGRNRPVVALTGDGGLLMCAGELLTAVRESLHVIVIVFADASLSLIDVKQQQRRLGSSGVSLGAVDWCAVANGLGAAAHRVETEAELSSAMSRALAHHGPTVIEARIDPGTYPETLHTIRG
jgi:acetolactate synthase-1/2/3 large subunit